MPRALDVALALAASTYVFVATFPDTTYTGPGLDGSCRFEVSRLATARLFGRDVAFTYGPLGFLISPMDVFRDVAGASLLRFAMQIALAICVGHALLFRRRRAGALALVGTQLVASAAGLLFEYKLLLLFPWILARRGKLGPGPSLVVAAALAGAALYVKTTLGVGLLAVCAVAGLIVGFARGTRAIRTLAASALAFGAIAALLGALVLRSPWDLPGWLRLSLQIADGFSVAMSFPGRRASLNFALALLATWAILTVWLVRRGSTAGFVALAFCAPIFLAFKHGFVRHDIYHEIGFLPFVLAGLGFVLLETAGRAEKAGVGAVLILALAGTAPLISHMGTADPAVAWHLVNGGRGFQNIRMWADLRGELSRQHLFVERAIEPDKIPGLAERVADRTVGIIPWELTYCRANGLRCLPNPTLQLFAAYTAGLDERTARHYAAQDAPTVVVFSDMAIDGRSVVLDTPATLRAVLEQYEVSPGPPAPATWMMERRPTTMPLELHRIGRSQSMPGRWMAVPESAGLAFAHADFQLSRRGRLEKIFFRVDPVYLDVLSCDGRSASFRIVPDSARNGLLVSNLAADGGALDATLHRRLDSQACWIRFSGQGLDSFRQPVTVDWSQAPADGRGGLDRFPKPSASALERRLAPAGRPLLAVDSLDVQAADQSSSILVVKGWGVDPLADTPAAGIFVEVAGRSTWIPTGVERRDVADHFRVPGYARSGYVGIVDLAGLPPGRHDVIFKVVSADGRAFYDPQRREVEIR